MVVLGATLYFVIFPKEYSGIFKYGMRLGSDAELTINVIGELPVFMTPHMESTLLGPNPTGVIGVMFLIVLAIALFVMLKSKSVDKQ